MATRNWGAELPTYLNGMFAYAPYDRKNRKLLVARDHLGIKPLYYAPLKKGGMAFASELKTLRTIEGWSQGINLVALDEFLAMRYIPSPLTIYEEAYKLPAGHQMVFSDGRLKIDVFWSVDLARSVTWGCFACSSVYRSQNQKSITDSRD